MFTRNLYAAAAAAKSLQSCPTLCDPIDGNPPGSPIPGILQARTLEWVAFPFSRGLPKSGIAPRSPTLQADSLPAESSGKPKNTGVSSLSLLQWIFQTQESNQGLLYGRQIRYELSYQGSPNVNLIKQTNRDACSYVKTMNSIILSFKVNYVFVCSGS